MGSPTKMPPPSVLAQIPAASSIPPGVKPNFVDPPSENGIFFGVCTTLEVIMLVFLALRLNAKIKQLRRLKVDDYLCITGTFLTTCVYITYSYCVTVSKYGTHYWNVSALFLLSNEFSISTWLSTWLLSPTYAFVKATFFVMYLEIFRPFWWMRLLSYIGIVWVVCTYLSVLIVQLYAETPSAGESFGMAFENPRYILSERTAVPLASLGLAIDICILLVPLIGVSQLQMSGRRKLGVAAVFTTGLVACIASAVGLAYRKKLGGDLNDITWATFPVYVTACVECQVGVICSCMPATSSLVRHYPNFLSSLRSKTHSSIAKIVGRTSASDSVGRTQDTHHQTAKDVDTDSTLESPDVNGQEKKNYDLEMQPRPASTAVVKDPNNVNILQGFEQYSTPRSALKDGDLQSPVTDQFGQAKAEKL